VPWVELPENGLALLLRGRSLAAWMPRGGLALASLYPRPWAAARSPVQVRQSVPALVLGLVLALALLQAPLVHGGVECWAEPLAAILAGQLVGRSLMHCCRSQAQQEAMAPIRSSRSALRAYLLEGSLQGLATSLIMSGVDQLLMFPKAFKPLAPGLAHSRWRLPRIRGLIKSPIPSYGQEGVPS
jgi:hypothetical protein